MLLLLLGLDRGLLGLLGIILDLSNLASSQNGLISYFLRRRRIIVARDNVNSILNDLSVSEKKEKKEMTEKKQAAEQAAKNRKKKRSEHEQQRRQEKEQQQQQQKKQIAS